MKLRMKSRVFIAAIMFVAILVWQVDARFVHQLSDVENPDPIAVQQCRLGCLAKFMNDPANVISKYDECSDRPNCYMCWDYCALLYKEKKRIVIEMCSDMVCFSGCKFACSYYKYFTSKPLLHRLEYLSVNE